MRAGDAVIVSGVARSALGFALKDGSPAGDVPAGAELATLPYVLGDTTPPMLVIVTSDFADGTIVRALKRSMRTTGRQAQWSFAERDPGPHARQVRRPIPPLLHRHPRPRHRRRRGRIHQSPVLSVPASRCADRGERGQVAPIERHVGPHGRQADVLEGEATNEQRGDLQGATSRPTSGTKVMRPTPDQARADATSGDDHREDHEEDRAERARLGA